jgi:SPP1 gp7 family putative phage head morphogenesis protein
MDIVHTEAYRAAFAEYLRKGTPLRKSLANTRATERYVWWTRSDARVHPKHRALHGHVFSWSDPPASGHPGEDYNCRCEAIPYIDGETEFAAHDFTSDLSSSFERWNNLDFIGHFFTGGGRGVTLQEIGHLREVAEQYAFYDGVRGAFSRLSVEGRSLSLRLW